MTVSDPGRSVAGALVTLYHTVGDTMLPAGSATVGNDGLAKFDDLAAGTYRLEILGPGNRGTSTSLTLSAGAADNVTLPLVQQQTLSGHVTAADGSPVEGATILLMRPEELESGLVAVSETDGSYSIPYISTGTYDLVIFATGRGVYVQDGLVIAAASIVDASLPAAASTVAGRLVDAGNRPIAHGQVSLMDAAGHMVGMVTADADGRFTVTSTAGSGLVLRAHQFGYALRQVPALTVCRGCDAECRRCGSGNRRDVAVHGRHPTGRPHCRRP